MNGDNVCLKGLDRRLNDSTRRSAACREDEGAVWSGRGKTKKQLYGIYCRMKGRREREMETEVKLSQ